MTKTINVQENVRRRMKAFAALQGRKLGEVVDEALEEYLNRHETQEVKDAQESNAS